MLRSSVFVFIAGWIAWFWLDKPRAGNTIVPPPRSESMIENFQRAFDIFKAGSPDLAFVYIWNAHYIVLSLLGGALVAVSVGGITDHLSRRRLRRLMVPERKIDRRTNGDAGNGGKDPG